MMRTMLFSLFVSLVAATNSGIFGEGGGVIHPAHQAVKRDIPSSKLWSKRNTNAHRMRAGLGPLPPVRRFSPTERALRPRSSPTACNTVSNEGIIAVYDVSSNNQLGYVIRTFDNYNSYTYGPLTRALTVSLPDGLASGVAFEMTAVNGLDSNHLLVGAVGGDRGYNFNPGQPGYASLSGTGYTPANSPPSFSAGNSMQDIGYNGPAESTIWMLDCLTLKLTAQWTNADGSQPPTSLFYDGARDFLGLVGDYSTFSSTYPSENSRLVTFLYVPNPIDLSDL